MADTSADLKKGCRVRLSGLSVAVLNGAEGCIVGPPDQESGRHPVKLLRPPEAVAAFPAGVKVKPVNLERVAEVVPSTAKPASSTRKPKNKQQQQMGGMMDPASWAVGLPPAQQAEWFVDCYRMRVDDDYAWGGCNLHGLYDPDATSDSIVADFLVFCKLAAAHRVVPARWDWGACLAQAAGLLGYAFEKADAKDKYGGENVFSAFMGGRSLRATAEVVYGTSCMAGAMGGDDEELAAIQDQVGSMPLGQLLSHRPELFSDVGGAAAWKRLRSGLQRA
ncbi:hypothetical protein GPECTOR_3g190 [Gonium pectorale]|uniref:Uncharacterized protein n=1 Tax=Gonium pectorale TaxID=33097 RepID=A0A150GYV6_GONPE|nr:hypothetical protein GPECTOR_3g190 [Gonium pectorale]|eukprot:KXZ55029.1 hypothetical protein GPECTOR_3g190 [Gonium pectorale]